jgi:hypothetical protein
MNIRMLAAFNDELLVRIGLVADEWESGVIEVASLDGDTVASLRLTSLGRELWPPTLPTTVA